MSDEALSALGGVGLFLLGMSVMTHGLRGLAGGSLRTTLKRFTRSPTSGAVTGALATAVIQSSSATTVTAVGFVGAGLLTFAEALGIIFGANLGTTVTGWLVALIGFKVELDTISFPLVLIGALMRSFGRGRWSAAGEVVAGFAVLFIGIDILQAGLAGLEGDLTPDTFPPDTWFGRVQLVGIGVLITLVTQSSSAGVALAITSVHAGTVTFGQAAAIVIGMDVGTTVTAVVATVGGGTQVRRTGLAHTIYNVLTGIAAFFLLSAYVRVVEAISPDALTREPELFLVGFHTLFNGLGVIAVLPLASQFADLVERLVPADDDDVVARLDDSLLHDPAAALDVLSEALVDLSVDVFDATASMLRTGRPPDSRSLDADHAGVEACRDYLDRIRGDLDDEVGSRMEAAVHVLDHVERLLERLRRPAALAAATLADPVLARDRERIIEVIDDSEVWLREPDRASPEPRPLHILHRDERRALRAELVRAALREGRVDRVDATLDAMRWLARAANHISRIDHYLLAARPRGLGRDVED